MSKSGLDLVILERVSLILLQRLSLRWYSKLRHNFPRFRVLPYYLEPDPQNIAGILPLPQVAIRVFPVSLSKI